MSDYEKIRETRDICRRINAWFLDKTRRVYCNKHIADLLITLAYEMIEELNRMKPSDPEDIEFRNAVVVDWEGVISDAEDYKADPKH